MREELDPELAAPAARHWWNQHAAEYRSEHHEFLAAGLVWGPEGWTEAELGVLGSIQGRKILDLGCGQGESSQWLSGQGARVTSADLSEMMLSHATGQRVCADAQALPFRDQSFDLAVSAYGALPFIGNVEKVFSEIHRTVRERFVFSVTHPLRWAFRDDPEALNVEHSYFDRRPYVERDSTGRVAYSEHHRTVGDWVNTAVRAGFTVERLDELEWKPGNKQTWGSWSPARGLVIPSTMLLSLRRNF